MTGSPGALALLLPAMALAPFAGALLLAFVGNEHRRLAAWIAGTVALAGCAGVVLSASAVLGGEVLRWSVPWVPALQLGFGFRMDGLAWMFALLILGIGALVVLYARYYLSPTIRRARFFAFLLLFMGAMLGVVLADNLMLLVVFWELTSLASFLLIGYWHHRAATRARARAWRSRSPARAGSCLLGRRAAARAHRRQLRARRGARRRRPRSARTRSTCRRWCWSCSARSPSRAQFPFHFWLPHAMAAPTPVSAYLHSATMVKAGVFLLARLYPALGGTEAWFWLVTRRRPGDAAARRLRRDLPARPEGPARLLDDQPPRPDHAAASASTAPLAVVAAVFHILNHATFKASLFMAAGIIDHETGTRDMRRLNGLLPLDADHRDAGASSPRPRWPGVPLLNGFLSKEMFFAETLAHGGTRASRVAAAGGARRSAGVFSVAYSAALHPRRVLQRRAATACRRTPHEPPRCDARAGRAAGAAVPRGRHRCRR